MQSVRPLDCAMELRRRIGARRPWSTSGSSQQRYSCIGSVLVLVFKRLANGLVSTLATHLQPDGINISLTYKGINAIIYYAPTVFAQVGLSGGTIGLLATGVVGILMFFFTIPGALMVDKVGRKPMLFWSLSNMAISHAIIAALIATYGGNFAEHKAAANTAIFFVYWYIVNYALPYGPVGWIITAESSSLDIRAKGVAIGSAVNWIMNFAVAEVTPVMITNIGYKTFLVFMCFCVLGLLWVHFILPELKGLTLEEIDGVFADEVSAEDRLRRERIAEELGVYNMAHAAADMGVVDERRGSGPKPVAEIVEV